MFSALSQGSLVHILEKSDGLKYKVGEVIGVSQPNTSNTIFNSNFMNPVLTLKVKIDDDVRDFPEVPSSNSIMSYNGGRVVICETIQGLQNEVENIYKRNKQMLNNRNTIEKEIEDCELIMKEISPQFARDKERDDRLNKLELKFDDFQGKIDKILNLVTNK